jgi:hypothetical protein
MLVYGKNHECVTVPFFMKRKKDDSWLKPRGYVHFTKRFNRLDKQDCKFLHSYVSTPDTVAKHAFFPLIHRPIIVRRYKDSIDVHGNTNKAHYTFDKPNGKKKSNAKTRHIYYSTHLDAYIYSYYCKEILSPLYEKKIAEVPGLSDCICAYRKIPMYNGSTSNKSNIHFAADTFKFIKGFGECVALTFDVSAFFDSLNQKYLKQQWCSLFGTKNLSESHHNVFKSLTRFSYVEYYQILKEFNIKNQNKLRGKKHISFCDNTEVFKARIQQKKLIKHHRFKQSNGNQKTVYVGIPQGTPISAFLSNLYMLEFDKLMFNEIVVKRKGLYKRYSDDIVVICKHEDRQELESLVINTIKDASTFNLNINPEKVDTSIFTLNSDKLVADKPLRYLGFEFDGQRALIKTASISKFYRQMKQAVRAQGRIAAYNKRKKGENAKTAVIYKQDLYRSFTHLSLRRKDRNFFSYAKEAAKVLDEKAILKQLSNTWPNLEKTINKHEEKLTNK